MIGTLTVNSKIPVFLRAKLSAETEEALPPEARMSYNYDIAAADRYELIRSMIPDLSARPVREYSRGIIKV